MVWVWVQEGGDFLEQEEKADRERKYFNGKYVIKNNPLSYLLYSSANWKWEACDPKVHMGTSWALPAALGASECHGTDRARGAKGRNN